MDYILSLVFFPYDALVILPYFWVKLALGIATGLFIPHKIIGLVACALGNVATFAYAIFVQWHPGSADALTKMLKDLWSDFPLGSLMALTFVFAGVVWWVVGRIIRWAFYKIRGHTHASSS